MTTLAASWKQVAKLYKTRARRADDTKHRVIKAVHQAGLNVTLAMRFGGPAPTAELASLTPEEPTFDDPIAVAYIDQLQQRHREYEQALIERAEKAERAARQAPEDHIFIHRQFEVVCAVAGCEHPPRQAPDTSGLREAAQAVLTELDIIRKHRETTGVGYLVVHVDTHEALRAALAATERPLYAEPE